MTSTTARVPESETPRAPGPGDGAQYVGLATRAVAFVIDAFVIDVVAVVVTAAAALIASVFHFPKELDTILKWVGLGVYVLWLFGYFVAFWSATGQTPGNRVLQRPSKPSDGADAFRSSRGSIPEDRPIPRDDLRTEIETMRRAAVVCLGLCVGLVLPAAVRMIVPS